jgi:hypothetical protein
VVVVVVVVYWWMDKNERGEEGKGMASWWWERGARGFCRRKWVGGNGTLASTVTVRVSDPIGGQITPAWPALSVRRKWLGFFKFRISHIRMDPSAKLPRGKYLVPGWEYYGTYGSFWNCASVAGKSQLDECVIKPTQMPTTTLIDPYN